MIQTSFHDVSYNNHQASDDFLSRQHKLRGLSNANRKLHLISVCLTITSKQATRYRTSTLLTWHVFGYNDDSVTTLKHRLRWLGHVLRMSCQRFHVAHCLPTLGPAGKPERWLGCVMVSWYKRCTELVSVGPSRFSGWGPRDGATQWLET
ncbi:unnamed protein product [Schistosoma mattheei]|uniref:Uncharacterized protein n=1 Tax=Schistosoma mattheei TaxID=31246 RepID=A0A183NM89_9TREM|nr:unnamed protein product [Schistosoma mattheei]VDO93258.1 unnamed protein product [Schistosoma mattheei]